MGKYRKKPVEIEAVQFTGTNWSEIQLFVGFHKDSSGQWDIQTFNKIGCYLPIEKRRITINGGAWDATRVGELWVAANSQWLPIIPGSWILKDRLGFYPCDDEVFKETYFESDPDNGYHDDETLNKVSRSLHASLRENGYLPHDAERVSFDMINDLLNVGILFRERK